MRRKDKEVTDQVIIREIFERSEICRIAMMDGDVPYIVPLNYGFSDNVLYFHSASAGKKINLLGKNNRVCFEIEYGTGIKRDKEPCQWTTRYRSVIGYGTVEIVTDREQKVKGLDRIMAHYGKPDKNVYADAQVDRIVILKLAVDEISVKQSGDWGE